MGFTIIEILVEFYELSLQRIEYLYNLYNYP